MKFIEVLQDLGIDYLEGGGGLGHVRSGWIGIRPCPKCGNTNWYLAYNLDSRAMNCWHCGPMKSWETLASIAGKPIGEIARLLGRPDGQTVRRAPEAAGRLVMPYGVRELQPAHRNYLIGRGIQSLPAERLWGLMGLGFDGGDLRWRVFIPIHYKGEIVSWTTRSIRPDDRMRYISASAQQESKPHKHLLYGHDYVRHAAIICEGPFDVMRIGPGAVCTFGQAYSQQQMAKMAKIPVRVICFDGERDAQVRARQLAIQLEPLPGKTYVVVLESGKDAGEASMEEIQQLRNRFLEDRQ